MGNYSIWETRKIKGSLNSSMRHNYRLEETANASSGLSYKNEELVKLQHRDFNEAFKKRIDELPYYDSHRVRKDAVRAIEVVLSYSPEADGSFDIDKWKEKSMAWIREKYDLAPPAYGSNIISAVFHGDEARGPHIHAVIIPIDERGHLNAKRYMGNMYALHQMKESYGKAMEEFGLVPGEKRYHNRPEYEKLQDLYKRTEDAKAAIPEPLDGESAKDYLERSLDSIESFVAATTREGNQRRWELQREAERAADKIREDATVLAEQLQNNARSQMERSMEEITERQQQYRKKEREAEMRIAEAERKASELESEISTIQESELRAIGYSIKDVYRMAEEKLLEDRALEWYKGVDKNSGDDLASRKNAVVDMYLDSIGRDMAE